MKNKISTVLVLLSIVATANAAPIHSTLPALQAQTVTKGLIAYQLTLDESSLTKRLLQQGNKNHLVLVDEKNHILNTMKVGETSYQLLISGKSIKSINLSEQLGDTNQYYPITQPLTIANLPVHVSNPSNHSSSSFTPITSIEISTTARTSEGQSCGLSGGASPACQLYANGNQQIPIDVNFNGVKTTTGFNPHDYDINHLEFVGPNLSVIPINGGPNKDGISISTTSDGYLRGILPQKTTRRKVSETAKLKNGPNNEWYLSFQNKPSRVGTTFTLDAAVTDADTGSEYYTTASQTSVSIEGVAPYAYTAADFRVYDYNTGQVPGGYQQYGYGEIGIDRAKVDPTNAQLGIHAIYSAPFPGQNYLDNGRRYGYVVSLPGIEKSPIYKLTDSDEYQDNEANTLAVYFAAGSIPDPNSTGNVLLPFYEIHDDYDGPPGELTVTTNTKITGTDSYGNSFSEQIPFTITNGKLTAPSQGGAPPGVRR